MSKLYIRSQDREKLVLFGEGHSCLYYVIFPESYHKQHEEIKKRHAIFETGNNENTCLGFYESKERCLEILDEIQKACSTYQKSSGGFSMPDMLFDMPAVYQMPEM